MITQIDIHLKLDATVATMLTQEAFTSGTNKNRLINLAVEEYVRMADAKRRWGMTGHGEEFQDKLLEICPGSVHLLHR